MRDLNESTNESAALLSLESLGLTVVSGLQITPGELLGERCGTVGQFGQSGRL